MKKLAIITTHPIQYYAPIFQLIERSKKVNLKVFYTWGISSLKKNDPGFEKIIEWDIPLLEDYNYEFLLNIAKNPGTSHFNGIINPNIIDTLEHFKPDIVLVFGWSWHSHLKVLRNFKGRSTIWFRGDSNILNHAYFTNPFKQLLKTLFLRWVYKHVDKAFYVGANNKSYYLKYGLRSDKLIFAPHAIDNSRFSEDRTPETIILRKRLNVPSEAILILFAGKFESIKNPKLLLKAFLNLKKDDVHLLFVGNGVLEDALRSIAKHPNIHFLNFQNQTQMPVIYQTCDLFCLPSFSETWGLSINEAMACGKAILASDGVGCAIDLIKPNINGEIFKSNNLVDLTEKLSKLTADKKGIQNFGNNSKGIIQKWNFEAITNTLLYELEN